MVGAPWNRADNNARWAWGILFTWRELIHRYAGTNDADRSHLTVCALSCYV